MNLIEEIKCIIAKENIIYSEKKIIYLINRYNKTKDFYILNSIRKNCYPVILGSIKKLLKRNYKYINNQIVEVDEFIGEAIIVLDNCVKNFSNKRTNSFLIYFYISLYWEYAKYMNLNNRVVKYVSNFRTLRVIEDIEDVKDKSLRINFYCPDSNQTEQDVDEVEKNIENNYIVRFLNFKERRVYFFLLKNYSREFIKRNLNINERKLRKIVKKIETIIKKTL